MYCVKISNGHKGIKYHTFNMKSKAENYLTSKGFSRCAKSKDTYVSGNMTAQIIAL